MSVSYAIDPPSPLGNDVEVWKAYRQSLNDLPADDEIVALAKRQADDWIAHLENPAQDDPQDDPETDAMWDAFFAELSERPTNEVAE